MDFRWVVAITLWTLLAGPIFGPPAAPKDTASARTHAGPPGASAVKPPGPGR